MLHIYGGQIRAINGFLLNCNILMICTYFNGMTGREPTHKYPIYRRFIYLTKINCYTGIHAMELTTKSGLSQCFIIFNKCNTYTVMHAIELTQK